MMKAARGKENRKPAHEGNEQNSRIKYSDVDFGTYHHSTPGESRAVRKRADELFTALLPTLFPADPPLRILDAGCGLGFLMYVAAKCFPESWITGVDLFKGSSVSELSIEKAVENMEALGIGSRTQFLKHDLTTPLGGNAKYDLVVSHVVFHNMGKKRFKAYETVFNLLNAGGFFVLGDLFPKSEDDTEYFHRDWTLTQEVRQGNVGPWSYSVKVLRRNET